jgi:hypothetical protein
MKSNPLVFPFAKSQHATSSDDRTTYFPQLSSLDEPFQSTTTYLVPMETCRNDNYDSPDSDARYISIADRRSW